MTVDVFAADEQHDVPVDVMRWVRLARMVLEEEQVPGGAELSLIFVDETSISDLNERFLGTMGPTDVLAFPMDDDVVPGRGPGSPSEPGEPPAMIGDVVVCPSYAQREAETRRRALDDELALLVVHGVLHLLSYDHAEEQETEAMQRRERELLERFRRLEQEG